MKQRFCQRNHCRKVLRHKFFLFIIKVVSTDLRPLYSYSVLRFTSDLLKFSELFFLSAWVNRAYGHFSLVFYPETDVGWCRGRLLPPSCSIKPSLAQPQSDQFRKEWCVHRAPSHWGIRTQPVRSHFSIYLFLIYTSPDFIWSFLLCGLFGADLDLKKKKDFVFFAESYGGLRWPG